MTIINPNSIAGITSVTAEAGVMNFYKSDGTLAGLQLNGVNFNTTSGISTFNNVYVGGTITYEDVKNVDSVGIITARAGVKVTGGNVELAQGSGTGYYQITQTSGNTVKFGLVSGSDIELSGSSNNSMYFKTNNTERVRITAAGYMGINTDSPVRPLHIVGNDGSSGATSGNSDTTLVLENAGGNGSMIEFMNVNTGAGHLMFTDSDGSNRGRISYHHSGDYFRFDTSGAERIRIASNGRTYINTTSPIDGNCTIAIRGAFGASGCGVEIKHDGNPASNRDFIRFYNKNNNEAGSIEHTSSTATAFQTSSDHRLKENIADITDGIERLNLLKPRKFSWIDDPELGLRDGFIAHEVSPVIPHCVSGEKDAVKEDGSIQTQTMEYSQLTPLLTAALQEAIVKIEVLEAKVAALEGS